MKVFEIDISELKPYDKNAKKHPKRQCIECGKYYLINPNYNNQQKERSKTCSLVCLAKFRQKLSVKSRLSKGFVYKILRNCKECNINFAIYKSALKTNASGNFCSRKCYNLYLCNTNRENGRGSRWKQIRKVVISRHSGCVFCGSSKDLEVHHLVPWRITHDNSLDNLVPLCRSHHKKAEYISLDLLKKVENKEVIKYALSNYFFDYARY